MQSFPKRGLRINCGSGQRPFAQPWINVDCNEKWSPDVVARGESMPMFHSGSADIIVLHHVLEHAGCGECNSMLAECRRILAPGGSLLVFVPDMVALAYYWSMGKVDDQLYFTNVYGAYMGDDADRHRWGYSWLSLSALLSKIGFRAVNKYDWRRIPGADIAGPDWWILGAEAIK